MQTRAWMPILINEEVCIGCNNCVETCPNDVYAPNPEKGKPPIVQHPDECDCVYATMTFNCLGLCMMDCPKFKEGAKERYNPWHVRARVKNADLIKGDK